MRILVVNNRFPPFITGGYELSAALTADGLARRGHRVQVLVSSFGVGGTTSDAGVKRVLHRVVDSPHPIELLTFAWSDALAVHEVLSTFQPDVISAWNLEGLFPEVLKGLVGQPRPVVFHLHDLWLAALTRWSTHWDEFWRGPAHAPLVGPAKRVLASLGRAAGLAGGWPSRPGAVAIENAVFCSEYQRRVHHEAGVRPRHSRVVLSGTDLQRFRPGGRPFQSTLRALFVGRLVPEKGPLEALRAVATLLREGADLELTQAGAEPPDRSTVDAIDNASRDPALRGRVRRSALVQNERMAEIYQAHDVLLFPTAHIEGLPRAVMEAMACGLAVVAAPSGGGSEILQHNVNCLVVGSRDAAGVEAALRLLLADRDLVRRLGRGARTHVETHHSVDAAVDAIEAFYREAAARGQRRVAEGS